MSSKPVLPATSETRNDFIQAPSPFIHSGFTIAGVMGDVVIALLPILAVNFYFFGMQAVSVVLVSVISCISFEFLWRKASKQTQSVNDLSAVVTGLILSITLPPGVRWWMVCAGAFVSIVLGKQVFGGLGKNFINPALAGRIFMQLVWPGALGISLTDGFALTGNYLLLNQSGFMGDTSIIFLLAGSLFLIYRKQIYVLIPIIYIIATVVSSVVLGQNVFAQILSGCVIFSAFFTSTDPSTTPVTNTGKFVFALGCGVLTVLVRKKFGVYESAFYSVFAMNLLVPMLDKYSFSKLFRKKE